MQAKFKFKKIDGVITLIKYNGKLEKVVIPETFEGEDVTAIDNGVFYEGWNDEHILKEVVLPAKLEIIGANTFGSCEVLEKINFPDSLKSIKLGAFSQCYFLKEIQLPANVEKVGAGAFVDCTALTKFVALNENTVLGKDVFIGCTSLEEISFHLIKTLDLDNKVKFLQQYFNKWDKLELAVKSEIITMCKKKALKNSFFLSNNVNVINILLAEKFKLKLEEVNDFLEYNIKAENTEVTAILLYYKEKNFSQKQVDTLKERNDLVKIGLELPTFTEFRKVWRCSKKDGGIKITGYKGTETEQTIPKSIADGTPITELCYAIPIYGSYSKLEVLRIEADLTTFGHSCFSSCFNLKEVVLPETLTQIYDNCFVSCESLVKINIPNNVFRICQFAFYGCSSLEEIVIPESVKFIGRSSFANCSSLTKVTFLGDMPRINPEAFVNTPYTP